MNNQSESDDDDVNFDSSKFTSYPRSGVDDAIPATEYPLGKTTSSSGARLRWIKKTWLDTKGENASAIYKAALRGDWEAAKKWFIYDGAGGERTSAVSSTMESPLHVAVGTGRANYFVRKLLELLPDKAVELTDCYDETVLHYAARVGNREAAVMLVDRNPNLLHMKNNSDRLPVQVAAIHCQKEVLTYLIRKSDPQVEKNNPFVGDLGVRLLMAVTASELFDVALELVEKYPDLARSTIEGSSDDFALSTLAQMTSAFPCGGESFWRNFIYSYCCVPSPKRTYFTGGDIEDQLHAPNDRKTTAGVKSINRKKLMHEEALELVKSLCEKIESLPHEKASKLYEKSIILAAKHGIHQVVQAIAETFPTSISAKDPKTGRNIFSLAVAERHENVFNLIYDMSDRKFNFYDSVDLWENNFLHLCAEIAPPRKLELVPGPALQRQRELQWFKEVEKFVHPSRREWPNRKGDTPRVLFSEKHRDLKTKGEEWMRSTANSCSVAAALVATIMFAAAFTVPGGVNSESGIPVFRDKFPFLVFVISDAVSLFTSLTSLLVFLSILTSRYAEEDFLYVLPRRSSIGLLALFLSVMFMMAAFGATMYLMLVEKDAWLLITVAALACLPVASFVLLQFPLLLAVVSSTYGPSIFGKKTGKLLY